MALLQWNEKLGVGVRQFDQEHKKLIELVNQLHEAMKVGQGKQAIGDVLGSLVNYTRSHFAAEERLMKAHAYPGYEAHIKEHNQLTMSVMDFQKDYMSGRVPISQTIMTFLKDWLTNHIQGMDKKYGPHLNGAGVK